MNILVRLPNWLGDMVMSTAFLKVVKDTYPEATVDLIAKKSLAGLLDHLPAHGDRFLFDKKEHPSLSAVHEFGRGIGRQKPYDVFFCLPDSFSTALMGFGTRARARIGYQKEFRSVLLTQAYTKGKGLHRVDEYQALLHRYLGRPLPFAAPILIPPAESPRRGVVVNINSEAQSRRLTTEKAVRLITTLRAGLPDDIILTGSLQDKAHVDDVMSRLPIADSIHNMAGQGDLQTLVKVLASCRLMVTTDSGPAHVANALGTPSIVLFGAGNEENTGPYDAKAGEVIRLGQLSCEPCLKNTCGSFAQPECLERLDDSLILEKALRRLS